jgi:hypothetical protein
MHDGQNVSIGYNLIDCTNLIGWLEFNNIDFCMHWLLCKARGLVPSTRVAGRRISGFFCLDRRPKNVGFILSCVVLAVATALAASVLACPL